jgi:hypothetical protein
MKWSLHSIKNDDMKTCGRMDVYLHASITLTLDGGEH